MAKTFELSIAVLVASSACATVRHPVGPSQLERMRVVGDPHNEDAGQTALEIGGTGPLNALTAGTLDGEDSAKLLCAAPCILLVPNGDYSLLAGRPGDLKPARALFDVHAAGGTQRWRLKPANVGLVALGAVLAGLGLAGSAPTGLALRFDDDKALWAGLFTTSLAAAVGGFWMAAANGASAEQLGPER